MVTRENALIALPTLADLTALSGYAVKVDANGNAIPIAADTDVPFGVISDALPDSASVAVCAGGFAGVVRVKLDAASSAALVSSLLAVTATGTATVYSTGAGVVFAQAVETGSGGELIQAVLHKPQVNLAAS
jgi:hypothetical protein